MYVFLQQLQVSNLAVGSLEYSPDSHNKSVEADPVGDGEVQEDSMLSDEEADEPCSMEEIHNMNSTEFSTGFLGVSHTSPGRLQ